MWRIGTPPIPKYYENQRYSFMTDNIPISACRKKGSVAQVLFEENDRVSNKSSEKKRWDFVPEDWNVECLSFFPHLQNEEIRLVLELI